MSASFFSRAFLELAQQLLCGVAPLRRRVAQKAVDELSQVPNEFITNLDFIHPMSGSKVFVC